VKTGNALARASFPSQAEPNGSQITKTKTDAAFLTNQMRMIQNWRTTLFSSLQKANRFSQSYRNDPSYVLHYITVLIIVWIHHPTSKRFHQSESHHIITSH
jgi:hypothetical protein